MGAVKGSDFVDAWYGRRNWKDVRELCGACICKFIWDGNRLIPRKEVPIDDKLSRG